MAGCIADLAATLLAPASVRVWFAHRGRHRAAGLDAPTADEDVRHVLRAATLMGRDGGAGQVHGHTAAIPVGGRLRVGALFRRISKGGAIGDRLSPRSIRTIISAARPQRESRAGGWAIPCASAARRVLRLRAPVSSHFRWRAAGKSPYMPAYCARHQIARLGPVAALRYGNGRSSNT